MEGVEKLSILTKPSAGWTTLRIGEKAFATFSYLDDVPLILGHALLDSLPPQGSAYIVLMLMVPKDWKQLKVTYVPTFLEGKSLTFVMNASDVIRS